MTGLCECGSCKKCKTRVYMRGYRRNGRRPEATRRCKACAQEYVVQHPFQKYCSVACGKTVWSSMEYTCQSCGETVQRHRAATERPKYCSYRCRERARHGELLEPRVCAAKDCDEEFTPPHRDQRYCSHPCATRSRWGKNSNAPKRWRLKAKGEEACRNCGSLAGHLHHIVPRSKSRAGREDVLLNGLPLCAPCHRGWHSGTVRVTRDKLTALETQVALERTNATWLDRNYPATESATVEEGQAYLAALAWEEDR